MKNIKGFGLIVVMLFGGLLFLVGCGDGKTKDQCKEEGKKWVVDPGGATNSDDVAVGECEECEPVGEVEYHSTDGETCVVKPPETGQGGEEETDVATVPTPPAEEVLDNTLYTVTCDCEYVSNFGLGGVTKLKAKVKGQGTDEVSAKTKATERCSKYGVQNYQGTDKHVILESTCDTIAPTAT